MKKFSSVVLTLLVALTLALGSISIAEAKRFGGGSSFGSRQSFNQPYQRSAAPQSAPSRAASQQQAAQQNQAARQNWAGRGGLMGMLGGLALGGLLGSLFFGGAFQHLNLMDIVIFAGLAFLLYKLFAAKAGASRPAYNRSAQDYQDTTPSHMPNQAPQTGNSGFDTDILFGKNKAGSGQPLGDQNFAPVEVPAGFDRDAFLQGAKIAFTTLQKAWDERDLAEIRSLSTDKVFAEIQTQLSDLHGENHTDVLKLEAELLDVREVGSELQAVVLFDAVMREDAEAQAGQVREVWHFVKAKNSIQPKWYLDGIQQLAE
ncbi:MAG: transporter [Methylobacter sp.]|nr:MAG: transporter [Methylobacter sp.]